MAKVFLFLLFLNALGNKCHIDPAVNTFVFVLSGVSLFIWLLKDAVIKYDY